MPATDKIQDAIAALGAVGGAAVGLTAIKTAVASAAGAVQAAASAAIALGPAAPFVLSGIVLAARMREWAESAENRLDCKAQAIAWLMEAAIATPESPPIVVLGGIPTAGWAKCWHRGLKTKDRKNGRRSYRIPVIGGVVRDDVLDAARPLLYQAPGDELVDEYQLVPALGPYALPWGVSYGYQLAPIPWATLLGFAKELAQRRPPFALAQVEAALRVALRRRAVAGGDSYKGLINYCVNFLEPRKGRGDWG